MGNPRTLGYVHYHGGGEKLSWAGFCSGPQWLKETLAIVGRGRVTLRPKAEYKGVGW